MDSIDDSLLSRVLIHLADHADRLRQNYPTAILVSGAASLYYPIFGSRTDVALIAVAAVLQSLWHHLVRQKQYIFSSALLAVCGVLFLRFLLFVTAAALFSNHDASTQCKDSAGSVFIPGRTTHSRFFPKKHSFAYSYLTVGIPVGLRARVNGILSVDPPSPSTARRWWAWILAPVYQVDGADYLARGVDEGGLRGKLNRFLVSQQVDPRDYPHAFLVTAPRFLGYSFNPVSFWYLYSPDKMLSAMILEVNNTFDERRPYLVFRDFDQESKQIQSSAPTNIKDESAYKIFASFEKDFHVSPFNSRKGSYSVLAQDPLGPGMQSFRVLDVTINLKSSKGHPKLVARLVNQDKAIEIASMSTLQKLRFVCLWFWIGFATFPRIVKEAAALFFRRGLHVWYRPEPLQRSLGRHATAIEQTLEAVFRDYLRRRVEQSPKAVSVRYIPSGLTAAAAEDVFTSRAAVPDGGAARHTVVEIRVLTPTFYSRFVHYAHDFEGIFNELAESQTLAVDKPDVLPHIFLSKAGAPPFHTASLTEYAHFRLLQSLRRNLAPIRRPMTSAETDDAGGAWSAVSKPKDIRHFRISSMDAYVLEHGSEALKRAYRSSVLRLFLANRFLFGSVELLSALAFIWRAGVAYLFASVVLH